MILSLMVIFGVEKRCTVYMAVQVILPLPCFLFHLLVFCQWFLPAADFHKIPSLIWFLKAVSKTENVVCCKFLVAI